MLNEAKTETIVFCASCCKDPPTVGTINVYGCDTTAQSIVRDIDAFVGNTLCVNTSRSHVSGSVFPSAQDRKNSKMLNDPCVPDDRTRACYIQTGLT